MAKESLNGNGKTIPRNWGIQPIHISHYIEIIADRIQNGTKHRGATATPDDRSPTPARGSRQNRR